MDYTQAVAYLYDRLPVFHRIGAKAIKPGLGNTEALCTALGSPHQQFSSIHVAGTNGKGSTSHMLASVYQAAGYKVGLYTSPHLKSFTERIRINGQPIDDNAVAQFVTEHQQLIESIEPSFFEVTVVMAFDYFARHSVDLAIIEVGLGGRLDSTNVITPLLSVITNIGLDHTDILGNTLAEIAVEKAGIIKKNIPVIIGETQPETKPVFISKANASESAIVFADQQYRVVDQGLRQGRREVVVLNSQIPAIGAGRYLLDLLGGYQLRNLPAVLAAVGQLIPNYPVPEQALATGLSTVGQSTGLKGRFQTLAQNPLVIADTAHNPAGIHALIATIATLVYRKLHLIIGFVADKDVTAVLSVLPADAQYYLCQAHSVRSLPVDELSSLATAVGLLSEDNPVPTFTDVNTALSVALKRALPDDLVVITGSTYLVAELTNL